MRHETYILFNKTVLLAVIFLIFFPLVSRAEDEIIVSDSASIVQSDSIVNQSSNCQSSNCQSEDSLPDWYIPPVIPDSLKAPSGVPESFEEGFGEERRHRGPQ